MTATEWIHVFLNKTPNHSEEETIKDSLRSHDIFQEIESFSRIRVNGLEIKDPIKRRMAIQFLRIMYGHLNNVLQATIENYTGYTTKPALINEKFYKWLEDVKNESMSIGIPEIFIDKYIPRLITNVDILTNIVTEVCQRGMYSSNKDTMRAVLDVTLTFMKFSMDSVEGIVNNMNGELHAALEGTIFDN